MIAPCGDMSGDIVSRNYTHDKHVFASPQGHYAASFVLVAVAVSGFFLYFHDSFSRSPSEEMTFVGWM